MVLEVVLVSIWELFFSRFGSRFGIVLGAFLEPLLMRFGRRFGIVSDVQNLIFELGGRLGLLKIHSSVRTSAAHERAKRAQCAKRRESVRIPGDGLLSDPFCWYLYLLVYCRAFLVVSVATFC